jgi:hypothetical protein
MDKERNMTKQPVGPRSPDITLMGLATQFRKDIYDKEVQSAMTYSYVWMADQMGHICVGILFAFGAIALAGHTMHWITPALQAIGIPLAWIQPKPVGLVAAAVGLSLFEAKVFVSFARRATGLFPLDTKLLRRNALIAAVYMVLGVGIGYAFHRDELWAVIGFIVLVTIGVILAPRWLRQKIVWQKAGLPYLFRLADAPGNVSREDAEELQRLIEQAAPPDTTPRQIVIGGPIGSGRTAMAAGIGTEFAFKDRTVRYLNMASLLEFAAEPPNPDLADETGPANIEYWRWSQAQAVIIDDVGPLISAAAPSGTLDPAQFEAVLKSKLGSIADVLAKCHTVWVVGDLSSGDQTSMAGETLNQFARVIGRFCRAAKDVLVIELSRTSAPPLPSQPKGAVIPRVAGTRHV